MFQFNVMTAEHVATLTDEEVAELRYLTYKAMLQASEESYDIEWWRDALSCYATVIAEQIIRSARLGGVQLRME